MSKITKIDWDQAFDAWVLVIRPKGEMTQAEYAKSLGVNHTWLSHRFTEIEVERISNKAKGKMASVMAKSLEKMDEGLDQMDSDPEVDSASKLRAANDAFKSTSDRLGLSPQANIISIQNTNQANAQSILTIPPMFQTPQDQEDLKQLLGGTIDEQD